MKPYSTYKTTGLDWLPQIPAHWEVRKLSAVVKERQEKNFGMQVSDVLSLSYGKIILRDMSKNGLVPESFETYHIVNAGNLILRMTDLQNDHKSLRVGLAKQRGIITSAYICFETLAKLDSNYAYYLLHAYDLLKVFYSFGGGVRQSLNFEGLRRMQVVVPPLSEQRAIVSYLDAKGREIAVYIAAKRALVSKLQELKVALIARAVTRGLDTNAKTQASGVQWMGEVPAHWEIKPLFAVAQERQEKNIGMQVEEVLSLSYGKVILRDMEKKAGLIPASFETYQIVNPGNIILRLTDLQNDHKSLRVGLAKQRGIITSAYVCLVTIEKNRQILPDFLYAVLHSYDISKVFYSVGGGVRQGMGFDDLKRLQIPLPPLSEQAAIVSYIEAQSFHIDAARLAAEREIELALELSTTLVAEVVCGARDVRGASLELSDAAQKLWAEIGEAARQSGSGGAEEMGSGGEEEE